MGCVIVVLLRSCMLRRLQWWRWLRHMLRLGTRLLSVGLQNRIDLPPPVFRRVLFEPFEGQKLWFGTHLFMTPMDMRLRNCGIPIDAIWVVCGAPV